MEFVHIRLRDGRDDDIAAWYEAQEDKSQAVRNAIRAYIRLSNGESQEKAVEEVVASELAQLPGVVAAAVRDCLSGYRVEHSGEVENPGGEDPVLAGNLGEMMDGYEEKRR